MCRSVVLHQVQIVPRTTAQRSVPITLSATNNGVCLLPCPPQTTECAYYLVRHKQRSVPITLSDTNNGVCLLPCLTQTTECAYYLGCHKDVFG